MEYAGWPIALAIIIVYIILVGILGYFSFKKLQINIEDYFLVSRTAGFLILYFTIVATYHSAYALLTSCGVFYRVGVFFWAAGTWTFLTGILTYLFGARMWYLGKKYGYITPADLLADYYESDFLRGLVAIVLAIFLIPYMAVQAMGLGYIFNVASGGHIPYIAGTWILLFIVALYSMAGGLRAVYWTDFLQGIWMFIAIWIAGIFVAVKLFGSVGNVFHTLLEVKPQLLSVHVPYTYWFSLGIIFSFGIVMQPHLWMRYYTARDPHTLKWLGATTPIYLIFIYVPAGFVGLTAAAAVAKGMIPEIIKTFGSQDATLPALLTRTAPAWFTGIFLAGASAAAMSTADSQMHAFSAVVTRDLYQKLGKKEVTQETLVKQGRIWVFVSFLLAAILATFRPGIIFDIVAFSGAGALQLLPATLGAIYPFKFKFTRTAIIWGIIIGSIVTLLFTKGLGNKLGMPAHWLNPWGFHGGMIGLFVNFIVVFILSTFTEKPSEETIKKFHGYLEEMIYGKES